MQNRGGGGGGGGDIVQLRQQRDEAQRQLYALKKELGKQELASRQPAALAAPPKNRREFGQTAAPDGWKQQARERPSEYGRPSDCWSESSD